MPKFTQVEMGDQLFPWLTPREHSGSSPLPIGTSKPAAKQVSAFHKMASPSSFSEAPEAHVGHDSVFLQGPEDYSAWLSMAELIAGPSLWRHISSSSNSPSPSPQGGLLSPPKKPRLQAARGDNDAAKPYRVAMRRYWVRRAEYKCQQRELVAFGNWLYGSVAADLHPLLDAEETVRGKLEVIRTQFERQWPLASYRSFLQEFLATDPRRAGVAAGGI